MNYTYLLNRNTKRVHRLGPRGRSFESCNVDAIRKAGNDRKLGELEARITLPRNRCKRCWGYSEGDNE